MQKGSPRIWATSRVCLDAQVVLVVKNLPANAGDIRDIGSIPGSGRSPEGDSLQGCARHKCMETHSSILAGESNGQRSLVGYSP